MAGVASLVGKAGLAGEEKALREGRGGAWEGEIRGKFSG